MSYVFGAAVTDNIQQTGLTASFTTNRVTFVSCWVRPTTLTATRVIWANGAVWTLAIDTTTTSVRFTADATTDGVFTAPAGLAVNAWTWIGVLVNAGTGPAGAVRIWTATTTTGPVEQTVTNSTAAVGAWVSGGSTFTIGNANAGSLAFQGEIGGVLLVTDTANSNLNLVCSIAASGTISQAQADQVNASFCVPAWRGDTAKLTAFGRVRINGALTGFQLAMTGDSQTGGGAWTIKPASTPSRATVTGATAGARTPRPWYDSNDNAMVIRRRRSYNVRS